MKLSEILRGVETGKRLKSADIEITGIAYDSRKVKRGDLFVALPGEKADGRDFIPDAIQRGAAAVVHESVKPSGTFTCAPSGAISIGVKNGREALALIANNYFSMPSNSLCVIGITGTNGKTTTSYILKSILERWGKKTGLIGTIRYMIGEETYEAPHTTPESLEFQGLLNRMIGAGCSHVVSEISSHALAQNRVLGTRFKAGIFTNLTRDHLDFHKTMAEYFSSKARLFRELLAEDGISVINSDDPYGRKLISSLRLTTDSSVYTFGLERSPDIVATEISDSPEGLRFKIMMDGATHDVVSPLSGLPNVYNILSAAGLAAALKTPWDMILKGISTSGTVTGRFEKVNAGQKFLAVVDYAHTEDALERLIYTARGMTSGKVITVFGCGGDRDKGKRPRMGAVATKLSDFVIITSDNPRSEKPEEIMKEIAAGAARKNFLLETDRREAIRRAVLLAEERDVVLIAGKGHESYQETRAGRTKFNDREVLEKAIKHLITRK